MNHVHSLNIPYPIFIFTCSSTLILNVRFWRSTPRNAIHIDLLSPKPQPRDRASFRRKLERLRTRQRALHGCRYRITGSGGRATSPHTHTHTPKALDDGCQKERAESGKIPEVGWWVGCCASFVQEGLFRGHLTYLKRGRRWAGWLVTTKYVQWSADRVSCLF